MTGRTILIVDDSSTMRRIIAKELTDAGHEVIEAKNGMEALSIIEWMDARPDLITLDIDMPVMDGFEVCKRLLAKRQGPDADKAPAIPIVFVSAVDSLENRRRGFQLEVTDFISKPFKPHEIRDTVQRILYAQDQFSGMAALVVEDSHTVRHIIKNILTRLGLQVVTAGNGLEALSIIEGGETVFDLIITDYMMPEMRGDELCNIIRHKPALDQVPLFMVSAFDDMELILTLFKIGVTDYLHKPFIEEELLARVGSHLRARKYVLEVEELNKKLQIQASHDALTGLYNRRYFQDALGHEFAEAYGRRRQLCCILFDLDFFKKVNDTHGHIFGDLVLKEASAIILKKFRTKDICARYGGEEFIVILPETSLNVAISYASTLLNAMARHNYSDKEQSCYVTCSIGVASFLDHRPKSADKLVAMADEALYVAKEQGRNRVCVYPNIFPE